MNQVFVPALASSRQDLASSWQLAEPLLHKGYNRGLMLLLRGGLIGLQDTGQAQLENLAYLKQDYADGDIAVMLSNIPLRDIDILHNLPGALVYINKAVDFAKKIPFGARKIVTFHLNSLVDEPEFLSLSPEQWRLKFTAEILPGLKLAAQYAKDKGIELKVETVPVPEFGDSADPELRRLRNPFYLTHFWGFDQVRQSGLGICLDICHNRTIYQTARASSRAGLLFESDALSLQKKTLLDDVASLHSSDIAHLNDGAGMFDRQGGTFKEGVTLGEGDIQELPQIINELNNKKIAFVLEINETDFINRPNTKRSLEYLFKL